MPFKTITAAELEGKGNIGKPDTPGVSAAEMQRILDEIPREVIIPSYNETVLLLASDEGAASIGASEGSIQQTLDRLDEEKVSKEEYGGLAQRVEELENTGATAQQVAALSAKAAELEQSKAEKSDVLAKDNRTAYIPAEPYNPATKKYVDETVVALGAGDMAKAVYDADGDGVVDFAADSGKLGGFSADHFATTALVEQEIGELDTSTLKTAGGAVTGTLELTGDGDAEISEYNAPPLVVGDKTGVHLELDGVGILAKGSGTTGAALYLNAGEETQPAGGGDTVIGGSARIDGDAEVAGNLTVGGIDVMGSVAAAQTTADAAQTLAGAAMPLAGGTFTGNAMAANTNRTDTCLRNALVRAATDSSSVSTNYIIFKRK